MVTLTCDCGYKIEDKDHYIVEGKMWHHAIHDHAEMIASHAPEQLAEWIRKADKTMNIKG